MILKELPAIEISNDRYLYNGNPVPRVTEILSAMLHEDYLMDWANGLGRRGSDHNIVRDEAANVGSWAHQCIESFLIDNKILDIEAVVPKRLQRRVSNAFNSFLSWWNILLANQNVKIIGSEVKLVTPWYGGTYDLLLEINGLIYLIDFKTSNHVGYKYTLQMAAYKYMIEQTGLKLDGVVILQLSKKDDLFYEYVINFNDSEHVQYMEYALNCFHGLVYSYHYRLYLEQNFEKLFNGGV